MDFVTFETIKKNFDGAINCMKNIQVSDDDGTAFLDLSNYELVKRFYSQIQVAIHGHDLNDKQTQDCDDYLSQEIDPQVVLLQLQGLNGTVVYVLSNQIDGFDPKFESRLIDVEDSIKRLRDIIGNDNAEIKSCRSVSVRDSIVHVTAAHPMPPSHRLSKEKIMDFDNWVKSGMSQ